MTQPQPSSTGALWARFRFSVVGSLLSSPPARSDQDSHRLPCRQDMVSSGDRTRRPFLGRHHRALVLHGAARARRPGRRLRRPAQRPRQGVPDRGCDRAALSPVPRPPPLELPTALRQPRRFGEDRSFTGTAPILFDCPAVHAGPRPGAQAEASAQRRPGEARALERRQTREIRSYEAEYVGALWHLDFHHGSLRVLTPGGQWVRPIALGILDDHSRLCCHVQWYLSETAEDLVHGLSQAIQKRGLPRALLTDNGSAMVAEEVTEGLLHLGIAHDQTLPYSPYQNGKQEAFWGTLEGRLMMMLDRIAELTLELLNRVTQAWMEIEYNRAVHRETSCSPVERFAQAPDVLRSSPSSEALRDAFRLETKRIQRQSDGTISLEGVRLEIPSRYRHFRQLTVRYARWNLGRVDLVDEHTGTILAPIYPVDKIANADGRRALVEPVGTDVPVDNGRRQDGELPPLLKSILQEYSATGLPPAYLPKTPPSQNGEDAS